MSAQRKKAVRNLYRTFLHLTDDVEQRAARLATEATTPLAAILARHVPPDGKQFATIHDIRRHIRDSFRQETSPDELKDQISQGIKGMRQMESLLRDLQSEHPFVKSTSSDSSETTTSSSVMDDSWVTPYVDQVQWLPALKDETSHASDTKGDTRKAHERVQLPMFPLTGPLFQPNAPLKLFTSYSYWEFPTPGAEITLKIFEPRYRELYNDLLTQPSNRRFVVPFAHPYQPATFAAYGLLYQITDWQEIADETNGVYQYICQHVVTYPVQLHRVLNPQAHQTQETYLRVEGTIEMDRVELDVSARQEIVEALMEHADASIATKCRDALLAEGVWGLLRVWNTHLQQRLLQKELQIAALVKVELQKYGPHAPSDKVQEAVELVQNHHRAELLSLKMDMALSIPRILQTRNCAERLEVVLDLIKKSKRKP